MSTTVTHHVTLPGRKRVDESTLIALVALYFTGLVKINEVVGFGTEHERIVSRLEGSASDPFPAKPIPGKLPPTAREVCTSCRIVSGRAQLRVFTLDGDPATRALARGLAEGFLRRWPGAELDEVTAHAP